MTEPQTSQTALLLHAPKQPYQVIDNHTVPDTNDEEILVRTQVIGLNPVDWKAPDFNFGIPVLPYVAGRELVGKVVRAPKSSTRLKEGDEVIVISTDYRDIRKAAFQEYVVASEYNVCKLPPTVTPHAGASLGVAFVAAAISLGVCMGLDFRNVADGPDLLQLVRGLDKDSLPADIRHECFHGIDATERAGAGDWIAIWGGSSTSANMASQLARLAGLHVLLIVNQAKHGIRLARDPALRPDLLVDSHDQDRAIAVIQGSLSGKLKFALDTQSKESAAALAHSLRPSEKHTSSIPTPPRTPTTTHLVGLAGLPKDQSLGGVTYHTVPIKLFHEVPQVGSALALWLERLLKSGLITPPDVLAIEEGFDGVNKGLDKMRRGEISGGRAVVDLSLSKERYSECHPH